MSIFIDFFFPGKLAVNDKPLVPEFGQNKENRISFWHTASNAAAPIAASKKLASATN
jgi:hypothetical protein